MVQEALRHTPSIRQHTSAYVGIRLRIERLVHIDGRLSRDLSMSYKYINNLVVFLFQIRRLFLIFFSIFYFEGASHLEVKLVSKKYKKI